MKTFRFSLMLIIAAAAIVGMDKGEAHALGWYKCNFTCSSLPLITYACADTLSAATPLCKANAPAPSGCMLNSTVYDGASCSGSGIPKTPTPTLQSGGLITKPGVPTLKPSVFQGGLTPQGN